MYIDNQCHASTVEWMVLRFLILECHVAINMSEHKQIDMSEHKKHYYSLSLGTSGSQLSLGEIEGREKKIGASIYFFPIKFSDLRSPTISIYRYIHSLILLSHLNKDSTCI